MDLNINHSIPNQFLIKIKDFSITIKREDLIDNYCSGNKFRKLKYNILAAQAEGKNTLLTFGGAFSNHIAATAYAAREKGFNAIGIIRGQELEHTWRHNATLHKAHEDGMQFKFISREEYRQKEDSKFIDLLRREFGDFYLVPEGGTNSLAIKGCEEILTKEDELFNCVCASVGTGGTVSGLINASFAKQQIIGFSALKGAFLKSEIEKLVQKDNWQINEPINIGGITGRLYNINGVQTVNDLTFTNLFGENLGYSKFKYSFDTATRNNTIYPSLDPSIFELKYPDTDIIGRVTRGGNPLITQIA